MTFIQRSDSNINNLYSAVYSVQNRTLPEALNG